jgi:hypothetical protein
LLSEERRQELVEAVREAIIDFMLMDQSVKTGQFFGKVLDINEYMWRLAQYVVRQLERKLR